MQALPLRQGSSRSASLLSRALLLGCFLLDCFGMGCSAEPHVFIKRVWPENQVALVIVSNVDNAPLDRNPRLISGGNATRLSFSANVQLRVHVRTYLPVSEGGPDFDRCGLRFGGSGGRVGGEQASWVSDVLSMYGDTSVELKPATGAARADFDLRFVSCDPSAYACDAIRVTRLPSPYRDVGLRAVAAVGDDLAFIAVGQVGTASSSVIGRLDHGAVTTLPGFEGLGEAKALAWDHGEHIYVTTDSKLVLRMDLAGRIDSQQRLTPGHRAVAAAADGTVISYGESGLKAIAGDLPLAEAARIASLSGDVPMLGLSRHDRIIAINAGYFTYFDGQIWKQEREIRPSSFETFFGLAVDPMIAAAVGRFGIVVMRSETDGSWPRVALPAAAMGWHMNAVRGVGPGRFMAGGQYGFLGLWHGQGWCTIPTMTLHRFESIDLAPSGRVAYAVAREDGLRDAQGPPVLRLDLPAPPP